MMALPHTQYVIAEASTPVTAAVNSSQIKTVSGRTIWLPHKFQCFCLHVVMQLFWFLVHCRHIMWSPKDRRSWMVSRWTSRPPQRRFTPTQWSSRPPHSTSSPPPPTGQGPVKFTSPNPDPQSHVKKPIRRLQLQSYFKRTDFWFIFLKS